MNRAAACLLLVVTAVAAPPTWGAGLRIALNPGAEVEADQRAMIAWNGAEEILVLSSSLTADEPTTVLEILPLPSRPTVTKGDAQIFHRATNVVNQRLNRFGGWAPRAPVVLANFAPHTGGELVEKKEIGPHHVAVLQVTDRKRFMPWLEGHLRQAGRGEAILSPLVKRTINEYLHDGFVWFVFDFIELDRTTGTADAIQYRFPTREVYFPMRVLRAREDLDSLRLLMLTPRLLQIPDLPPARVRLAHEPIRITAEELRYVSKDMDQLLRHRPNMFLRVWSITGRLGAVRRDLVTGWW